MIQKISYDEYFVEVLNRLFEHSIGVKIVIEKSHATDLFLEILFSTKNTNYTAQQHGEENRKNRFHDVTVNIYLGQWHCNIGEFECVIDDIYKMTLSVEDLT